ncbi:MAG TPA: 4-oxalomesaconate tautomerase [Desulfobacterales bacterium]|nr:4-oxalomesaconate tautomerase [Desulfobacterales bacterium]
MTGVLAAPSPDLLAIPCVLMRGGTSKAAFFLASDLPADPKVRDLAILAAMDGVDRRQIDGLGGANPLTTKVAIISLSQQPGIDVDYLFGQVVIGESRIDYAPTCGNILAAVGPFALETGLVPAQPGETKVGIRMVNTGSLCDAIIQTPDGFATYEGETAISGVPGTSAPIQLRFRDIAGSTCGSLFPTGKVADTFCGVEVTCVDNGMPVVVMRAESLGVTGNETARELDANTSLKARVEEIRLAAGEAMGLGDVRAKVVPKMTLVSPAVNGGDINTRTFIPRVCHDAIGVLGAVSVATACVTPGSPANLQGEVPLSGVRRVSVEHPTGEFTVALAIELEGATPQIRDAALLRTARRLFQGLASIRRKAVYP